MSTIASAVAASEGSTPKQPSRRTRTRLAEHADLGDHPPQRVDDLVEVDPLLDRLAQRLVHDRDRADPADRLLQRQPGRLGVHPPRLQAQQRGDGLEVVLHPVVDLADRGVLGHQLPVAPAQVGDVAHQDQRPDVVPLRAQRDGAHDQRHALRADLGVPVRPPAEDRAEGLLVGPATRRHQLAGGLRQGQAGQVAGEAQAPVDRERVRAGVDHAAGGVDAQEPVADPRASRRGRCAVPGPGSARGRSSGSGPPRSAGRTARAGSACGRRAGWCCGRPRRSPGPRDAPGSSPPGPGTSSRHSGSPSRTRRPCAYAASISGRRPTGTNVPTTSSTYAVGPVVGRICPAAQKPLPSRSGSQSTRSAKDRSAMICQSAWSSCSQATSSSSRSVWLRTRSVREGTAQA